MYQQLGGGAALAVGLSNYINNELDGGFQPQSSSLVERALFEQVLGSVELGAGELVGGLQCIDILGEGSVGLQLLAQLLLKMGDLLHPFGIS